MSRFPISKTGREGEAPSGPPKRGKRAKRERAAHSPTHDLMVRLENAIMDRLRDAIGEDAVVTEPGALMVYESDGLTAYRATPPAVLFPRTTEQVASVVRILDAAGIPFVARGAGTGLSGGALALKGAVVISLTRMDRIILIEPSNRTALVQPGVVNARITAAARAHGLYYAPDPSSQTVCTIGGNIAENSGGPHCLKYGVTLNHVLGMTVVLPNGEVVRLGGAGRENDGYDLLGLFIGSEGTFGIATEIEIRLMPVPGSIETMLALFDDIGDACRAVGAVLAAGVVPAAIEMVDREAIIAVEASVYRAGMPTDVAGALVIELDGPEAGLSAQAERVARICEKTGARAVRRARDEADRQRLWNARKKAFGAMGRIAPDMLVQDAVVPPSKLPQILAAVYRIAGQHKLTVCNMFHAGDGNLHPTIAFDRRDPDELKRVQQASREMMRVCVEAGGTITGEHGIGLDKREAMTMVFTMPELQQMCAVRNVFDPRNLANPAKLLPLRSCREWTGPATERREESES